MAPRIAVICLFSLVFSLAGLAQVDTVTILHLNDTHSNLSPTGPRLPDLSGTAGGIARAATFIGLTRMTEPNVLLLHAGDFSIGDLFYNQYFGVPELRLLQQLGCDAMTVGNHEFDLTPSTLESVLDSAFTAGSFPLLSANLVLPDPSVQGLAKYIFPYAIRAVGGRSIGLLGLTTPSTNILSQPSPAIIDTNFIQIAAKYVDTLQGKGCDAIIVLSHLGYAYDQAVAANVPGISAIVGGHDHLQLRSALPIVNPLGDTTWIVQANAFYQDIGRLRLVIGSGKVRLLDYACVSLDGTIPEEPTTAGVVSMLVAGIESTYGPVFSEQIVTSGGYFEEVADSLLMPGAKDTPVGNLVTDAFRAALGTQIAFEAGGSTAQVIHPGPIVSDDLFRVVGYGFNTGNGLGYRMATCELSGAGLMAGLEFGLSAIEMDDEYFLQVSGMTYRYDPTRDPGSRLTEVLVAGQPVDPGAFYSVAANEFAVLFLDYLSVPYQNLHVYGGDTTEFQVVAAYVAHFDTLRPVVDGRIQAGPVVGAADDRGDRLPGEFDMKQNYPNPFNPSTTIMYSLPESGYVSVKLINLLGQEVATLVDGYQEAGTRSVVLNAADLSSGVYFATLSSGGRTKTIKITLMK